MQPNHSRKLFIGFRDLNAWKSARDLAVSVFHMCESSRIKSFYSLRDQIQRAAISVPSNIAEGDERGSNRDSLRFLYIAKGSLAELETQIEIGFILGVIEERIYKQLIQHIGETARLIGGLIRLRCCRIQQNESDKDS